jgi:hypothetical protein
MQLGLQMVRRLGHRRKYAKNRAEMSIQNAHQQRFYAGPPLRIRLPPVKQSKAGLARR